MSKLEQQIAQVVDTILEDYSQQRDIDRMEYHRQPDKDKLIDIIEKMRRIVFPGYFREKTYRSYNDKHRLSMLIEDVMYNLTEQVTRVLQTEEQTQEQAREKAQGICLEFWDRSPRCAPWCRPICRQPMTATRRQPVWQRSFLPIPDCLPLRCTVLPMCCIPLMCPCCPEL